MRVWVCVHAHIHIYKVTYPEPTKGRYFPATVCKVSFTFYADCLDSGLPAYKNSLERRKLLSYREEGREL